MVNTVYPEFQEENLSLRTYLGPKTRKNGRFLNSPEIRAVRFGVLGGRINGCTLNKPIKVGIHSLGLFGG